LKFNISISHNKSNHDKVYECVTEYPSFIPKTLPGFETDKGNKATGDMQE
jgi:hypothetical protein